MVIEHTTVECTSVVGVGSLQSWRITVGDQMVGDGRGIGWGNPPPVSSLLVGRPNPSPSTVRRIIGHNIVPSARNILAQWRHNHGDWRRRNCDSDGNQPWASGFAKRSVGNLPKHASHCVCPRALDVHRGGLSGHCGSYTNGMRKCPRCGLRAVVEGKLTHPIFLFGPLSFCARLRCVNCATIT